MIYKPASVTPVGAFDTLTSADDPLFIDTLNRPALAQTFSENANGGRFTVVVNHLKSKGSDCDAVGDPDTGDGQGNCNVTRTERGDGARQLAGHRPDRERRPRLPDHRRPELLRQGGPDQGARGRRATRTWSTTLPRRRTPTRTCSTASPATSTTRSPTPRSSPQVTGVTEWHINADEPIALDYNTNFKTRQPRQHPVRAGRVPVVGPRPGDRRHLPGAHAVDERHPERRCGRRTTSTAPWLRHRRRQATSSTSTLVSATSNEPDNGADDGNTTNDIVIVDDLTVKLRAERSGTGTGRIYTMTWQATNACGATVTATATVLVPKG